MWSVSELKALIAAEHKIKMEEKERLEKQTENEILSAIRSGNLQKIKNAVNGGYKFPLNTVALKVAVSNGQIEIIKYLVEKTEFNFKTSGQYYLWDAIVMRQLEVLKYFIDNGADPQRKKHNLLSSATKKYQTKIFEYLISVGYNPTKVQNNAAFINSIYDENMQLLQTLVNMGCDFRSDNDSGLLMSARCKSLDFAKYLISLGCDPRCQDDEILINCLNSNKLDFLKYFIGLGCDPRCRNDQILIRAINYPCYQITMYLISLGCYLSRENHYHLNKNLFNSSYCSFMHIATNLTRLDKYAFVTNEQNDERRHIIKTIIQPEIMIRRTLGKNNLLRKILSPISMHIQLILI
jgi:ankyrin repeat protein